MSGSIAGRWAGEGDRFQDGVDWEEFAGAKFLPVPGDGLQAWWRAWDLADDHVDGEAVATWPDYTPNGHDLVQATGANQPIYHGGAPTVRFDGSDDYMTANSVASIASGNDTPITLFYSIVRRSVGTNEYPWSFGNSADSDVIFSAPSGESDSSAWRYFRRDDAGGSDADTSSPGELVSNEFYVFVVRHFADATYEVRKNGSIILSGPNNVGQLTADRFALGALLRGSPSNYFDCAFGQFGLYDRAVSDTEADAIQAYMNQLYKAY